AGRNVTVGSYLSDDDAVASGQGAAFVTHGTLKLLAVAVVNACGNVHDQSGALLAGKADIHARLVERLQRTSSSTPSPTSRQRGTNTLLAAVITNAALDRLELQRVAVMSNAAAARVIDPFHS